MQHMVWCNNHPFSSNPYHKRKGGFWLHPYLLNILNDHSICQMLTWSFKPNGHLNSRAIFAPESIYIWVLVSHAIYSRQMPLISWIILATIYIPVPIPKNPNLIMYPKLNMIIIYSNDHGCISKTNHLGVGIVVHRPVFDDGRVVHV